jgi:hypothetical protein
MFVTLFLELFRNAIELYFHRTEEAASMVGLQDRDRMVFCCCELVLNDRLFYHRASLTLKPLSPNKEGKGDPPIIPRNSVYLVFYCTVNTKLINVLTFLLIF